MSCLLFTRILKIFIPAQRRHSRHGANHKIPQPPTHLGSDKLEPILPNSTSPDHFQDIERCDLFFIWIRHLSDSSSDELHNLTYHGASTSGSQLPASFALPFGAVLATGVFVGVFVTSPSTCQWLSVRTGPCNGHVLSLFRSARGCRLHNDCSTLRRTAAGAILSSAAIFRLTISPSQW